ncbi:MAG: glycoside hydrolase family 73 protein [Bacteroidota bacterium]
MVFGIAWGFLALRPSVEAQSLDSLQKHYIETYRDLAVSQMRVHRIPASITLAQGLLESAAGTSPLATKGNNHFGIKCGMGWRGDSMHVDDDRPMDCFRVYPHADSSYADRIRFLGKARYRFLFDSLAVTDYRGWALGLKKAGYATDTAYPVRLIGLIERLALHRLDTLVESLVVESPREEPPREEPPREEPPREEPPSIVVYSPEAEKEGWIVVTHAGDSPLSVAERMGLPLSKLQAYNHLGRDENLFEAGRVLIINRYRYERYLKSQKGLVPEAPTKGE